MMMSVFNSNNLYCVLRLKLRLDYTARLLLGSQISTETEVKLAAVVDRFVV